MPRNKLYCVLTVLFNAAKVLTAQDLPIRPGALTVTQATVLRARPSNGGAPIGKIGSGTKLVWVNGQDKNGFRRVLGTKGPIGWVPVSAVHIDSQPPSLASMALEASNPCAIDLNDCNTSHPDGCSPAGSDHGLVNELKRRVPADGAPADLTFADFASLQQQADNLVGQNHELAVADRATLASLNTSSGDLAEGSLVRVVGFIAQSPAKAPHANTGESVNCNLKGIPNNDFHIALVEHAGDSDFDGIVIEMIPQDRNARWSLPRLLPLRTRGKMVMVTGALFYDNLHTVNADSDLPVPGQPPRFALWEVHPITKFLVCQKAGNRCDPVSDADWAPLEQ